MVPLQWPASAPRSRGTSLGFVAGPPHIPQLYLYMFSAPCQWGHLLWILTFHRMVPGILGSRKASLRTVWVRMVWTFRREASASGGWNCKAGEKDNCCTGRACVVRVALWPASRIYAQTNADLMEDWWRFCLLKNWPEWHNPKRPAMGWLEPFFVEYYHGYVRLKWYTALSWDSGFAISESVSLDHIASVSSTGKWGL